MVGTTNFFFNNFQSSQEQLLLENLIIEAIAIHGIDVYYIPRKLNNYDSLYGSDDQSSYEQAFPIAMYIESFDNFKGDGNFMSKFGLEIRDQVIFSVAQRIFQSEVANITAQLRPNEGDLIYFPLNQKCFQIKFVEKFEMFFQLGKLYTWQMTTEVFEYSNEKFSTGIPEIDILQTKFDTNDLDWGILDENGNILVTENLDYLVLEASGFPNMAAGADNVEIDNEADQFVDFSTTDPFSEGF
jgi:hypothetical protein